MNESNFAQVIDGLAVGFEEFKAANEEKLAELQRRMDEDEKRRNRPGALNSMMEKGDGIEIEAANDAPGYTVLTKSTLASRSAIAQRLGLHADGNPYGEAPEGVKMGDFLRAISGGVAPDHVKSLVVGTDSLGGYAVPDILMPGILAALAPSSSLLSAGANLVMVDKTAGKSFNIAGINTIPTAAWRNENGAVAESAPAFRAVEITPRSLSFMFKVSRELMQDAPGVEMALNVAIGQAFAKEMDRAGLRGSGTAPEIRGLLNTVGVHVVESGADGAALTNYAKFIEAARKIKEANAPAPTAVIMSPREDESVALFADTTGQPLRRPDALANWQFLTSSQIPTNLTVGTSTDCSEIYVGDFTRCAFFLREGVSVQVASELYAGTGQVAFICHARVDVAPLYPASFAVVKGVR